MTKDTVSSLDENTRRYYLEVMGIQSWELLDSKNQQSDTDVASGQGGQQVINWRQLENDIQQCNNCQLHKTRKQAIVGRENQSADLMFILASPDANDDASGVLCSGDANELLGKMLAAINVAVDNIYITSLLKCCVPDNHTISPSEIQQCNVYLKQQIQLLQPKLVIVLGETAIHCVMQKSLSIDDFRVMINDEIKVNEQVTSKYQFDSVPLFVTYSPQELLQQPENKRKAWQDLQILQKII